jgi:signal transduction histidine kinase/CheY-like chemotaxis protein
MLRDLEATTEGDPLLSKRISAMTAALAAVAAFLTVANIAISLWPSAICTAFLSLAMVIGSIATRINGSYRRARFVGHLGVGLPMVTVLATGLVEIPSKTIAFFYLGLCMALAAHMLGTRPAKYWTLVATGLLFGTHLLEVALGLSDLPIGDVMVHAVDPAVFIGFTCVLAIGARRLADRQIAEVERLNAELEQANRAKSVFLANMSHEIRTPMNGVVGMTELLLGTPLSIEQHDLVSTIQSSGTTLVAVINDVLDFSKIEAGKMQLDCTEVPLRRTIEEVGQLFAERAQSKNIELVAGVRPDVPEVVIADGIRIRQIVSNLLSNAVKFTERGEIILDVRHAEGSTAEQTRLRFSICDTGPGISKEAGQRLFRAFEQADASTTRRMGGTGLGLAISKQLVELMDGAIGLDSEEGRGSTFWFELPLNAAKTERPVPKDSPLQKKCVLLVDNHPATVELLSSYLTSWGMHVASATSAEAAWQLLETVEVDVTVIDLAMPEIDGLELARRIRLQRAGMPQILFSPMAFQLEPDRAETAGVHTVLSKPVRYAQLSDALIEALTGRQRATRSSVVNTPAESYNSSLVGQRVLLVEDNPVNRKIALRFIERLGATVETALNGAEAVAIVRDQAPFSAILMDCQMPIMDGYVATGEIRKYEQTFGRHTPVIALTANALGEDAKRCLDAGMDAHLSKPYTFIQLAQMLQLWCHVATPPEATRGKRAATPNPARYLS